MIWEPWILKSRESEDWGVGDLSRDREQREGLVWCCCCCDLSSTRSLANNGMGHRGAYYHATLSPWLTPPWCNRRAITISASDHRENTKVQLDRPSRSRHSGRHHPYWQAGLNRFAIPGIFHHIAINSNSFMRFSYLEKINFEARVEIGNLSSIASRASFATVDQKFFLGCSKFYPAELKVWILCVCSMCVTHNMVLAPQRRGCPAGHWVLWDPVLKTLLLVRSFFPDVILVF